MFTRVYCISYAFVYQYVVGLQTTVQLVLAGRISVGEDKQKADSTTKIYIYHWSNRNASPHSTTPPSSHQPSVPSLSESLRRSEAKTSPLSPTTRTPPHVRLLLPPKPPPPPGAPFPHPRRQPPSPGFPPRLDSSNSAGEGLIHPLHRNASPPVQCCPG